MDNDTEKLNCAKYKPNVRSEVCGYCEKPYEACRPWQKFCTQRCRLLSLNIRISEGLKLLKKSQ